MEPRITVAVIDDHPLFRDGVVHTLSASDRFDVVGEGASADDAIRLTSELDPDVVLLDLKLPGGGLVAVDAIVAAGSRSSVLILTVVDDEEVVASAFRRGARGYLLKGTGGNELIETVRTLARGDLYVSPHLAGKMLGRIASVRHEQKVRAEPGHDFTEREEQILALLSHGLSNKEIAFRLQLSEKTVKYYLTHVLKKLHVRNRVEAALFASQRVLPAFPTALL